MVKYERKIKIKFEKGNEEYMISDGFLKNYIIDFLIGWPRGLLEISGDQMNMNPKISIIIPCNNIDMYTLECVDKCKELEYDNFEIIVLPDYNEKMMENVKIVVTGKVSPGKKRNIGINGSVGEFLAFIDSDAYPRKDWLKNAMNYFKDPKIAAIGGPGITPESDPIIQKAGGYVLSSFMVGGLANRFKTGKSIKSDDIHSCNFIVRRSIVEEIGGWDEKYWPGEDTLICLAIKKLGKEMIEIPEIVVNHHRRPLFVEHLRQVSRFGQHRGHFAKRFPDTSLRLNYFVPTIFITFIVLGGIFSLIDRYLFPLYMSILSIYILGALTASSIATMKEKDLRYLPLISVGIVMTHMVYGSYFIQGLLTKDLER